jgi:hypothetical protein
MCVEKQFLRFRVKFFGCDRDLTVGCWISQHNCDRQSNYTDSTARQVGISGFDCFLSVQVE